MKNEGSAVEHMVGKPAGKRHALSALFEFAGRLAVGLWAMVLWGLGLALVFSVGYWGLSFAMADRQSAPPQWQAVVEFDFPGIDGGTYPNGSPFVHADLSSTKLLERALQDTGMAEDISANSLRQRLTIMPAAPGRNALITQYRERFDQAEPAEWAALEKRFVSDLQRLELAQARLMLRLDSARAPALIESIVQHWADYVTTEAGLFSANIELYSAQLVSSSTFGEADPIIVYDRYRTLFELLNRNIAALQMQPNIGRARSTSHQLSLADLTAEAAELRDFGLERLSTPVLLGGLSDSPEIVLGLLRQRSDALAREREVLLAKVEQVDRALGQYDFDGPAELDDLDQILEGAPSLDQAPNAGSGFLQQLMRLGGDVANAEFRQALSRERLDYALEATALAAEKIRLEQLVQGLGAAMARDPGAARLNANEGEIQRAMAEMEQGLSRLFTASEELAEAVSRLRFGGGNAIYQLTVSAAPLSDPAVATPEAVDRYWRLLTLLLLVATLVALSKIIFGKLRHG